MLRNLLNHRGGGGAPGDGQLVGDVGDLDAHHELHPLEEVDEGLGLTGLLDLRLALPAGADLAADLLVAAIALVDREA